jgi:hypothetical protein
MKPYSLLVMFLVVFNGLTVAQDSTSPGIARLRGPDDYQSRTLKSISLMKPEVSDLRDMQGSVVMSPAEVKFVDLRLGRPPLAYLTFDVRLRNNSESSRWFLLPSNIGSGHEPIGRKGGVDALEAFLLLRNGRVTLGRFLGTGGFHALLLPAHADIRLRRFPISYWGELPDSVPIEIVIAKSLTIGSEPAESWFESSPLSSREADILKDADQSQRLGKTKHTKDNKEISPAIDEERRVELQVSIKPR